MARDVVARPSNVPSNKRASAGERWLTVGEQL
jgi:hypothetical protein